MKSMQICEIFQNEPISAIAYEWRGKFLKKLWCCVGGRV